MVFDQVQFFERVGRVAAMVRVLQFMGEAINGGDAESVPGLSESACRLMAAELADRCSDVLSMFRED